MALVIADRVQQQGSANTTVSFTLSSGVTGYQSFSVIGNGNTTYYAATDASGNWEVGVGTYSTTGPTLTRTTIISSSNSGSAVSTFGNPVNVFVTYPAEDAVYANSTVLVAPSGALLPTSNGGTGTSGLNGYVYGNGSSAMTASTTIPTSALTGTVAIANGGTGQSTASAGFNALSPITTTGDLIIGNGTNSATRLGIGTNGYLLTSNGTTATWAAAPASGVTKAQAIAYSMTLGF